MQATPDLATAPPLTRSTKHWYALGQGAEGLKNEAFSLLLLFYYTSVLGLSGELAGLAILIALLFDAVTDPLAGSLSDRLHSPWGRRHPFLYAGMLPLGLFFYLTFAPPEGLSQQQLFLWLTVMTVATRASMTCFSVPHQALGAELSKDYEERTEIVTLQFLYARTGHGLLGLAAFVWYFRATPEYPEGRFNPAAYPELALVTSVIMVVSIFMSARRTQNRIPYLPKPDPEVKGRSILSVMFGDLIASLRNGSFRALFVGLALTYIAWGVTIALGLHVATYFWRASNTDLIVYGIFTAIGIFVGLPYWERACVKLDKKPTFIRGLGIFTVFVTGPAVLKLTGFWPATDSPYSIGLWVVTSGMIAHFGIAATMVTGRSMMADVTDQDALENGRRREGIFFGAVSFAAKASFGVGSLIAGLVVSFVGLLPNQAPDEVGPEVVQGLGVTLAASILLLCGGSLLVFSRYRLTRARHAEIQHQLALRSAKV